MLTALAANDADAAKESAKIAKNARKAALGKVDMIAPIIGVQGPGIGGRQMNWRKTPSEPCALRSVRRLAGSMG